MLGNRQLSGKKNGVSNGNNCWKTGLLVMRN
jgi:hypothetical protein